MAVARATSDVAPLRRARWRTASSSHFAQRRCLAVGRARRSSGSFQTISPGPAVQKVLALWSFSMTNVHRDRATGQLSTHSIATWLENRQGATPTLRGLRRTGSRTQQRNYSFDSVGLYQSSQTHHANGRSPMVPRNSARWRPLVGDAEGPAGVSFSRFVGRPHLLSSGDW